MKETKQELGLQHGRLLSKYERSTSKVERAELEAKIDAVLGELEKRDATPKNPRLCNGGGSRRGMTVGEAVNRLALCICGRYVKVRPVWEGNGYQATLPNHLPKGVK